MEFFKGLGSVANVHPLFVHFPIGLLISGTFFFIAGSFLNKEGILLVAKWNIIVGSIFAVITVATGLIAESTLPHNVQIHNIMELHEKFMISTTILSLILSGYLLYKKDVCLMIKNKLFIAGLVLLTVLLTIGADLGGRMVFEYGAGTKLLKIKSPNHNHSHSDHGHTH